MPELKPEEIRAMSYEEKIKKLEELRKELISVRGLVQSGGSLPNPMRVRELKRSIARILTILREEQLKEKREGR